MLTQEECHRPVGNLSGTLKCSSHRKFQFHREIALVLFRDKALRYKSSEHKYSDYGYSEHRKHSSGVVHRESYHPGIERGTVIHPGIYLSEYKVLRLFFTMRLEELGAHDRAQCQSHDSRYDHRYGDSHGKLTEELTGNSREEAHRHEHGTEHERHGDKRSSDFLHSFFGSLIRRKMLGRHDTVHVFHHHDSVVDHDSDRQDETEKGHHIQRESEDEHNSEGSYQ